MCDEDGGVVDDLIVHKVRDNCCFVVVDTANRDKDFQWMRTRQFGGTEFEDTSDRVTQPVL